VIKHKTVTRRKHRNWIKRDSTHKTTVGNNKEQNYGDALTAFRDNVAMGGADTCLRKIVAS